VVDQPGVGTGARPVPHGHVVTGGGQVTGHGEAHDPETHEGDLGHGTLLARYDDPSIIACPGVPGERFADVSWR
jgi:hypothetical protein